ncbi:hypothetical protein LSH36_363g00016 [Paralvinella palmiformis]|uniref:SH2 domain-containing protein n=1 Tax=Paralvinella palmiformis TaxID=53620 RepID=A0AAD9JE25_9ANNE|nr:hypothetical protein LSH36_363g00016 [Paralvinella palmiformis]
MENNQSSVQTRIGKKYEVQNQPLYLKYVNTTSIDAVVQVVPSHFVEFLWKQGPTNPFGYSRVKSSGNSGSNSGGGGGVGGSSSLKFQQLKLVGDETLRQKRGGLRKVIPEYSSSHNNNQQNNIDDDDDGDESGGIGGIKNILKKLAKQSSLFRGSPKMGSSEPKTKTLPARSLPQPPPTSRPLPNMSSNDSSRSSASSDNSSGSGTFVPPRRVVAPLPPAPAQTPASPIKQYNRRVEDEMWYFDIERNEVQDKLESSPGMFLVRPSKLGGPRSPYTLCVFHGTRIYNLNIRLREDASYALGTPHANEKTFKNVAEMINYHHNNPITLAGQDRSTVLLTESPIRDDIYDQTM